jgi:hypothetical protein
MDDVGKQGHQTAGSARSVEKLQLDVSMQFLAVGACQ